MDQDVKYAGFWLRFVATVIDNIWLGIVVGVVVWLFWGSEAFALDADMTLSSGVVQMLLPIVIVLAFWIRLASTPGKMLFNMKIVDADSLGEVSTGRWVLRYIGYFVSVLPLFLGFFWVGFDKKKQAWHDKMANTVVIIES